MAKNLLSPKNLDLIDFICDNKILKSDQIYVSFFKSKGTRENASNILRRLFNADFISRDWLPLTADTKNRRAHPSAVYFMTKANFGALRKALEKDRRADEWARFEDHYFDAKKSATFAQNTLYHEIGIARVKLALESGIAKSSTLSMPLFLWTSPSHPDVSQSVLATIKTTDNRTKESTEYKKKLPVNPDAFYILERDGKKTFYYLEFDNNTETTKGKLTNKFYAYTAYLKQSIFAKELLPKFNTHYDLGITNVASAGLRVLFVTTNQNRCNDLFIKSIVLSTSGVFNFTTINQLETDPTGAIWMRKKEFAPYLDAYQKQKKTARPSVVRAYRDEIIAKMEKIQIP